jgi:hypothetical protein
MTTPVQASTPGSGTRLGLLTYTNPGVPVRAQGTITVASNAFVGETWIVLGQYRLPIQSLVGVDADATAIAIANAISAFHEYDAVALLNVITLEGPIGPVGNEVQFYAAGSNPNNLVFSPDNLRMSGAEPFIGPYTITG